MSRNFRLPQRLRLNVGVALAVLLLALVTIGRTSLLTSRSSFLRSPASGLSNATPVDRGVGSVSFLTQVGGVAFGAVAQPATVGLQITHVAYDATRDDGERLLVTLNGAQVVNFALADWLLVPAARFAAGSQHACFTLFGTLQDAAETAAVRQRGYDILNYHGALENTLAGLRLFHADVLVLSSASADLPTHDGSYVLGRGEGAPNVSANQQALAALRPYMISGSGEQIFRSYLITDYQQPITFQLQSGKLMMDGWPLWYLWRFSVADDELDAISDTTNAAANAQLNAEYQADAQVLSASALDAKYTDLYVDARFAEIYDDIISPQILQALPNESQALSTQIRTAGGVNPTVYAALTNFMRASALFRYVRLVAPEAYASFLVNLPCAATPSLYTPIAYELGTGLQLDSGSVPGPQNCGPGSAGQAGSGQGGAGVGGGTTATGGTLSSGGALAAGGRSSAGATSVGGAMAAGGAEFAGGGGSAAAAAAGRAPTTTGGALSVAGATSVGGVTAAGSAASATGGVAAAIGGTVATGVSSGGASTMPGEAGSTFTDARVGGASNGGNTSGGNVPSAAGGGAKAVATAGSAGAVAASNPDADHSADTSGCSCRVSPNHSPWASWMLLALACGLMLRRRSRSSQ